MVITRQRCFHIDSLTFGAEDRLTAISSVFSATYDGDGTRATKTEGGTETYFIYSGDVPVIEETYSGSTATISAVNVWGADGWRARYYPGTPEFYGFNFDPEGNVTNQQDSINTLNPGFCTTFYEAYGHLGNTWLFNAHTQASNYSPAGFGAQWGYYTDTYSILMGHRYYGLKTGRFLNRDPSGYGGGINLYAYADQNPVNEFDPSGNHPTDPNQLDAGDPTGLGPYYDNENNSNDPSIPPQSETAKQQLDDLVNLWNTFAPLEFQIEHNSINLKAVAATLPTLGPRLIFQRGNVRIVHNYHDSQPGTPEEHGPAHAHVVGGGPETRIGPQGHPLRGDPGLTSAQREAVEEGGNIIRHRLNIIGRLLKALAKADE